MTATRSLPLVLVLSFGAAALAGCLDASTVEPPLDAAALEPLAFTPLRLIDEERSGGEPVIAITPTGAILVAAHPGWTHTRLPPSGNLVTPGEGQSYIWRSEDGGETWQVAGPLPRGPKGPWAGVSDPDFAIDSEGRVFFTDLGPLTHTAVVRSDDDGKTWQLGNPAMPGPVDRQWLVTVGTDVFLSANYFRPGALGPMMQKSSDGGVTWTTVGYPNCNGDNVADQEDGTIYIGCENGLDVSTDGGATWERREVPGTSSQGRTMAEPALDAARNVYVTWSGPDGIWLAGTADKGLTWTTPVLVSAALPFDGGVHVWPWVVAGDEGRVAVLWFGTPTGDDPETTEGEWFVYQATVLDAMGASPVVVAAQATDKPIHVGPMCQSGTICQADQGPRGDRRLGDFFEAAVDADGYVHSSFSVTTLVQDSIAHAGYVKQVAGPRLRA